MLTLKSKSFSLIHLKHPISCAHSKMPLCLFPQSGKHHQFVIFTPELALQFMEPVQQKVSAKYLLLVEENSRTYFEAEQYDYIHIWPQVVVGFQVTRFFSMMKRMNKLKCSFQISLN
jgi:hypothetical protein